MSDPQFLVERLESSHSIETFNCGVEDLNDFLINNAAMPHQVELLTVTYLINVNQEIAAFYSLCNDNVSEQLFESNRKFKKFRGILPEPKQYRNLPAVKIGRLGVDERFRGMGIGSKIIDMLKFSFTTKNKTGCRFITVDAYNNKHTLQFYLKNEFEFFTNKDLKEETRSMYFDLMRVTAAKPN
jgi:GNAT superfamily N-acetyltransferase